MCKICDSPQRQTIEADMAAMPERAVAAKWEINRNQVQKHRNRCMKRAATAPAASRRVAALRERIKTLLKREKAADKAGDFGEANRCSEAIDAKQREIETLQAGPTPKPGPLETRFVVKYEDAEDRPDEIVHPYADAVRSALGFRDTPLPSVRADVSRLDLAAQLDFQSGRETGRIAQACALLARVLRNEIKIPDEVNDENTSLAVQRKGQEARDEGQGAEPQADGNGAA